MGEDPTGLNETRQWFSSKLRPNEENGEISPLYPLSNTKMTRYGQTNEWTEELEEQHHHYAANKITIKALHSFTG